MCSLYDHRPTTPTSTLSLHDALPILRRRLDDAWTRLVADDEHNRRIRHTTWGIAGTRDSIEDVDYGRHVARSEEHTSELQSRGHLVCRLLLEKKKQCTP